MTKTYFVNENIRHNAQMQAVFLTNRGRYDLAFEIYEALGDAQCNRNRVCGSDYQLLKESAMAFESYRQDKNN